jgi:peptide/nickel transport system substrate-binding protein
MGDRRLSRRRFIWASIIGAAGVALSSNRRTVAAPYPTGGQPRPGGALRVGRLVDIQGPAVSLMANPSYILSAQVYNALIHYDEKYRPQPELAESWDISKDGKRVTLNLRKDIHFHTGREFTSEDVKYNTLRVRDPKLGMSQLKVMSEWISDIETPDKNTVIYGLSQPRPAILDLCNYLFIVDRETVEGPSGQEKGVGTGPFVFSDWVPGDHVRFTKNPHYWVSGRPYLDEVRVNVIKDPQALGVQLEAGALDLAELLPEDQSARYARDAKYRVVLNQLSGQFYCIGINVTKPPLDNKKVRQALNYAIDRPRFARSILSGLGHATDIPWPPQSPAYDAIKASKYVFDLGKAKALLEDAHVTNLHLDLITAIAFPALAKQAEILQADLRKVGVALSVETPEPAVANQRVDSMAYQLQSSTFAFADLEPSSLLIMAAPFNYKQNSSGFTSAQYTKLVDAAAAEMDPQKRKALDGQLTDLLLDESFTIPLARRLGSLVSRTRVHGAAFRPATTQVIRLEDTWLEV